MKLTSQADEVNFVGLMKLTSFFEHDEPLFLPTRGRRHARRVACPLMASSYLVRADYFFSVITPST